MRTASLTLAALVSAAVALPLGHNVIISRPTDIPLQQHRRGAAQSTEYVDAAVANALCDTVNGLTKIIQSSDIGQGVALGMLKCHKLPRISKEDLCSSSNSGGHNHHHGKDEHSHDGHHHHGKGGKHNDEVFDGNHGTVHAVHPHDHSGSSSHPQQIPEDVYGPLLGINLDLGDTIDGVLRAVKPLLGSDTVKGAADPDVVKHAVESATGSGSGGPLLNGGGPVDEAGSLLRATIGGGVINGVTDKVVGQTGPLLRAVVGGAGVGDVGNTVSGVSSPAGGIVNGNSLGSVTDAARDPTGSLIRAAVHNGATPASTNLGNTVHGAEHVIGTGASGPLANPGGAGSLLRATVHGNNGPSERGTVNNVAGNNSHIVSATHNEAQGTGNKVTHAPFIPLTDAATHGTGSAGPLIHTGAREGFDQVNTDESRANGLINGVVIGKSGSGGIAL